MNDKTPTLVCSECSFEKEVEDVTDVPFWSCPECGEKLDGVLKEENHPQDPIEKSTSDDVVSHSNSVNDV